MTVIIQLQYYSLADSGVFHDVKNITQSSLHPTQPNPPKIEKISDQIQPNTTHGWTQTQPMTNSGSASGHTARGVNESVSLQWIFDILTDNVLAASSWLQLVQLYDMEQCDARIFIALTLAAFKGLLKTLNYLAQLASGSGISPAIKFLA